MSDRAKETDYRGPETCERQKAYDAGVQAGTIVLMHCDCGWCAGAKETEAMSEPLDFDTFRRTNENRCVNGFGHTLESWSPAEWTNALCGEAGEAANVAKKMLRHRDRVAGNRGEDTDLAKLKEKLGRELADVVIYADLVASSQGLQLGELVRETFNRKSEEIGAKERL